MARFGDDSVPAPASNGGSKGLFGISWLWWGIGAFLWYRHAKSQGSVIPGTIGPTPTPVGPGMITMTPGGGSSGGPSIWAGPGGSIAPASPASDVVIDESGMEIPLPDAPAAPVPNAQLVATGPSGELYYAARIGTNSSGDPIYGPVTTVPASATSPQAMSGISGFRGHFGRNWWE